MRNPEQWYEPTCRTELEAQTHNGCVDAGLEDERDVDRRVCAAWVRRRAGGKHTAWGPRAQLSAP